MDFDIVEAVHSRRLSYFGNVCRMKLERIPARVLHGRIHGSRPKGRPKKKWLDSGHVGGGLRGMRSHTHTSLQ